MSHVADTILIYSLRETLGPINKVQEFLREPCGLLAKVDGYAGGRKCIQCSVWMGGLNYLRIDEFVVVVAGAGWEFPEHVQLLVKDEHDSNFSLRWGAPTDRSIPL